MKQKGRVPRAVLLLRLPAEWAAPRAPSAFAAQANPPTCRRTSLTDPGVGEGVARLTASRQA
jgi:hypothetical protein